MNTSKLKARRIFATSLLSLVRQEPDRQPTSEKPHPREPSWRRPYECVQAGHPASATAFAGAGRKRPQRLQDPDPIWKTGSRRRWPPWSLWRSRSKERGRSACKVVRTVSVTAATTAIGAPTCGSIWGRAGGSSCSRPEPRNSPEARILSGPLAATQRRFPAFSGRMVSRASIQNVPPNSALSEQRAAFCRTRYLFHKICGGCDARHTAPEYAESMRALTCCAPLFQFVILDYCQKTTAETNIVPSQHCSR